MPLDSNPREPHNMKALVSKLNDLADARDRTAICEAIQKDLGLVGKAQYEFTTDKPISVTLESNPCLVFLIVGGFKITEEGEGWTTRRIVGHIVRGQSITLTKETAVVLVSGYA